MIEAQHTHVRKHHSETHLFVTNKDNLKNEQKGIYPHYVFIYEYNIDSYLNT
jgi:hypothetical protein